jgi:hypothetical protein
LIAQIKILSKVNKNHQLYGGLTAEALPPAPMVRASGTSQWYEPMVRASFKITHNSFDQLSPARDAEHV